MFPLHARCSAAFRWRQSSTCLYRARGQTHRSSRCCQLSNMHRSDELYTTQTGALNPRP